MRDCLQANPSKPQSCFWWGSSSARNNSTRPLTTPTQGNLNARAARVHKPFKCSLHKRRFAAGHDACPVRASAVPTNVQRVAARSRKPRRLRRASFFYRSSSKYRGSASAEPSTFRAFSFPPFEHFQKPTRKLHERLCRSLPFEALSPKRASNDHANPRSQGSTTVNQ